MAVQSLVPDAVESLAGVRHARGDAPSRSIRSSAGSGGVQYPLDERCSGYGGRACDVREASVSNGGTVKSLRALQRRIDGLATSGCSRMPGGELIGLC